MKSTYSHLSFFILLLFMVSCNEEAVEENATTTTTTTTTTPIENEPPVIINPNYPEFSWDKMPLYMHVRKSAAFTADEIQFLADFPLITIEKSTGYQTYGSNENGTIEAATAIKNLNPEAKILYYKNAVINWGNYEEDEAFLSANPEALLTNDEGELAVMPNGVTGFFDISQEYVRDYWLNHVNEITNNASIDGLFVDANIKVLVPSFFSGRVGEEKQQQIEYGYFSMMEDLNTQMRDDNLFLANIVRVRPDFIDSGREFLNYFDGSYLEAFDNENFGMTYANYLATGIEAFQNSAREGKVMAMSINFGEDINGTAIGSGDGIETIELNEELSARLDYLLAIFLVCAEQYSYIYPHDGFNSLTSATWLKTFSQYKKNLGAPTGNAIRDGYIYTRSFEHLDVWLDIENQTAQLDWK
ncbi:putative glycoside hydrolase [Lacinutrix himadriensis]|uniref:putative glycoside hydrolase n=1 Tax=Lacinutrix himadriensis TaxID=641549 RepID=UPI0009F8CF5D|nr:putative glycoside hydrolase [Lacinutrix himadriensis]